MLNWQISDSQRKRMSHVAPNSCGSLFGRGDLTYIRTRVLEGAAAIGGHRRTGGIFKNSQIGALREGYELRADSLFRPTLFARLSSFNWYRYKSSYFGGSVQIAQYW
jgi:hypothetical protein